jgi:PqqA peptide cyclase
MIAHADQPGLARGVRLVQDPVRGQPALLYPEGVLLLNDTAAAILASCDGIRTVAAVVELLTARYEGLPAADVHGLLTDLATRRLIVLDGTGHAAKTPEGGSEAIAPRQPLPIGMLAELTYRCPLHCAYCANPVNLGAYTLELDTVDWLRVLDQARALGVLQVHLSGGEPLLRRDLAQLVRHAHDLGMYTNLVTSGIPLSDRTWAGLVEAGLDHLQLSIQDSSAGSADGIAGLTAHGRKLAVAAQVSAAGLPLTVNVVLHRSNVDNLLAIADLAAELQADRVELAHTQFYGWAWRNRAALMPTDEQVTAARQAAAIAQERYGERMQFVYVAADYHSGRPKPCMNGWASRQFVVAPNGDVLPCLAAAQLPGAVAPNVHAAGLDDIWYDSELFNRFRGTDWLPEPCQSCALKDIDFGGCRCQAYQLTQDAAATDPACELSPDHHLMAALTAPATAALATPRRLR